MIVPYSEISTWLRCQKSWEFSYKEELVLNTVHARMEVGTAGHRALECLLRGGSESEAREAAMSHMVAKMSEFDDPSVLSLETATAMGRAVWGAAMQAFKALGHVAVVVHPEFGPLIENPVYARTPFPDVQVRGTSDAVLEFPGGLRLVVDHKFRKSFRSDLTEPLNLQMGVYQGILLQNGIETHGSMQHQVNPNPPSIPKINKDGKSVSRAACNTTPEIYLDQVARVGGDPADYADMLPKLNYRVSDTTNKAYRSPREVDLLWNQEVIPALSDILDARAGRLKPRRSFVHEVCQSCSNRELCIEELKGGDVAFMKQTRYRNKNEPFKRAALDVIYEDDDE